MSFLTPLYLLGLGAVLLPVVLHLIRRMPRGQYAFSSLMFLTSSPPRLTRRSRLDHLLLLLLRATALSLLAIAFARPFFRTASDVTLGQVHGRQVALLVDASASMRRGDLWRQARAQAEAELRELEPADQVALFAFDGEVRTVVGFEEELSPDHSRQQALVRRHLSTISPTWAATDLGAALLHVAETLQMVRDRADSDLALQIVLISDLQQGAELTALQAGQWPEEICVSLRPVKLTHPGNASLRLLAGEQQDAPHRESRVRVMNTAESPSEQLSIRWGTTDPQAAADESVAVQVPPGQSRVIQLQRPPRQQLADRIVLAGDRCDFDNTYFVAPPILRDWRVVYVGNDTPESPEGFHYYLQRAVGETPQGKVVILPRRPAESLVLGGPLPPQLAIVSESLPPAQLDELKKYVEAGGAVLMVPGSREAAAAAANFTGKAELGVAEAKTKDYMMLGDMDFTHPVLAAFAGPRYSDFTKIHFWTHFHFSIREDADVHILARFDNGDPALWEQTLGRGRIFVLASGWRPRDSQLALSSKFVPLLFSLLEQASGRKLELPSYQVNDMVELPASEAGSSPLFIIRPGGQKTELPAGTQRFVDTAEPGIYRVSLAGQSHLFAVNLASRESDTPAMDADRLEQLGVRLGKLPPPSAEKSRRRQEHEAELESRQVVWRWLVVCVLSVLLAETWWAGRQTRRDDQAEPGSLT